jgi:hypothetical protein
VSLYRRLGGLPHVTTSEDRALVRRAEQVGARVAYERGFRATVSARLDGRAAEGMAATIRQRLEESDPLADQDLRPVSALRREWAAARSSAPGESLRLPPWRRLRASDLERQIAELEVFVTRGVEPDFASQWGIKG